MSEADVVPIRFPFGFPFGSRRYRLLKTIHKYFRQKYFLDAIAALLTFALGAMVAFNRHPYWAGILLFGYISIQLVRGFFAIQRIQEMDAEHKALTRSFFHYMNGKLFPQTQNYHRFTLFIQDDVNKNYIIPYVRYYIGAAEGETNLDNSKVRYPKNVSYTGMAWGDPEKFLYKSFPSFADRQEFERFYIHELKIPHSIVKNISDYMVKVRHIFCFGFVDDMGNFIAVLSLLMSTVFYQKNKSSGKSQSLDPV
ncbi:MAG: hypothetical protein FP814_08520 [Desulfobacterium sp.]|nr:hypothetical protein [Desulfobacterium sp.]